MIGMETDILLCAPYLSLVTGLNLNPELNHPLLKVKTPFPSVNRSTVITNLASFAPCPQITQFQDLILLCLALVSFVITAYLLFLWTFISRLL